MQRLSTLLMATLLSLPVLAQDQVQGQEQEQQQGQSQQQTEQRDSGQDIAREPPVPQQARNNSGQRAERDADDYRPSEEISEDLSVSYPVDI